MVNHVLRSFPKNQLRIERSKLTLMAIIILGMALAAGIFLTYLAKDLHSTDSLILQPMAFVVGGLSLFLLHKGYETISASVLINMGWLLIAAIEAIQIVQGFTTTAFYILIIVMAGFVLGRRHALAYGGLAVIAHVAIHGLKEAGYLPAKTIVFPHLVILEANTLLLIIISLIIYFLALSTEDSYSKLKKRESQLSAILNAIDVGVMAVGNENKITFMNPVAESMTGWAFQNTNDQPFKNVFNIIDEKSSTPISYDIHNPHWYQPAGVQLVEDIPDRTFLLSNQKGKLSPISLTVSPVAEQDGSQHDAVLVFRDLTRRRHMKRLLNYAQKLDSLNVVASGITHDFNNIMMMLLTNASILSHTLDGKEREVAGRINHAGQVAAKLVNQFQQYTSDQELKIEVLDVHEVVNSVLKIVENLWQVNVTLKHSFTKSELFIQGDESQLSQVVLNLVLNSLQAMDPDGGTITVETDLLDLGERQLEAYHSQSTLPPGRYALFAVHDTGIGMSPETQLNVFDLFFTTKPDGHGLGLPATQGIILQHGGGIRLQSTVGVGTSFFVLFPLFDRAQQNKDAN